MAKKRICKVCGKEYEYCGHCPNKNVIEPWRNLYCSETCRDAYSLFDDYVSKKKSAVEVKNKLQVWGLTPSKVREVHKSVVSEIFKNGTPPQKVEVTPAVEVAPKVEEVEPIVVETPIVENKQKKPYFDRKKKNNNIVNEED